MERRSFLKSIAAVSAASAVSSAWPPMLNAAALPKAKITRVRIFLPPKLNQTFNQSDMIVTVETDAGLTGIGEGGTKDTLEQCAQSMIGENPFQIERIWQKMYMEKFYPPGREKIHAQGALDMALWDIKGKALGVPVHDLLGGTIRNYCECYQTSGPSPSDKTVSLKDRAAKAMEAGFRAFRVDASIGPTGGPDIVDDVYNTHQRVHAVVAAAKEIREGVGPNGDWALDLHQKFDYPDTLRCCKLIEEYEPYFVEDPIRDEQFHQDIPKLRQMTTVPITAGEEWGQRWDFNTLVENHDLDYVRVTLPNVGGITELMKILALCETHAIGIIPHFTGPLSTAALVNVLSTYSRPVLFEYNYGERVIPHLPQCMDFKKGKLYPNDRVGLGVTADMSQLKMIGEVTQSGSSRLYYRPDGSLTHW